VTNHLIDVTGETAFAVDREALDGLDRREDFYWLDLHGPSADELDLLGEVYGFHTLALDDAKSFGQRPKLDPYDGHVFLVVYGAASDEDDLVEVNCFYSERYLVTVRRDPCPAFAEVRERQARRGETVLEPVKVLYRVVDGLVDSFFPTLSRLDDHMDAIEEGVLSKPGKSRCGGSSTRSASSSGSGMWSSHSET